MEMSSRNHIPLYDVKCNLCRIKIVKFLNQIKNMVDNNVWIDHYVNINIENFKIIFDKVLQMNVIGV